MDYKERIEHIGIKKKFLAEKIGITPIDFSNWLGGRFTLTTLELAELENIIQGIEVVFSLRN